MEHWPKHKSGIRPDFLKQPIVRAAKKKYDALFSLVTMYGTKINDLWRVKRPKREVSRIDKEIKLKTSVLESPPELFPNLRHPAGCSLQYLIMLAECLGGAEWYNVYINRHDEADVDPAIQVDALEKILETLKHGHNYKRNS